MDGLRLAVGTLTALPVRPPDHVGARTARTAVLLAPVAVAPLGIAVAIALWLTAWLDLAPLASGLVAVAVLALGTRAFHLDGLADTADGLTSSYDRERSLAVMKSGSVGPAGAAAVFIVLGLQVVGFAGLAEHAVAAGLLVCLSRASLALTCMRLVPAAEGPGLRAPFAGSVAVSVALTYWLAVAAVAGVSIALLGGPWRPVVLAFVIASLFIALLVRRTTKRLGGVTGDVFGAAIELTLAALLVMTV